MGKMAGGGGGARRCTARTTTSDGAFEAAPQNTTIKLGRPTTGGEDDSATRARMRDDHRGGYGRQRGEGGVERLRLRRTAVRADDDGRREKGARGGDANNETTIKQCRGKG